MRGLTTISLVAVTLLLGIAPANAQYHHYSWNTTRGGNVNVMQAQLQARINRGIADGRLSSSEANRLQGKLNRINNLEARMRAERGLSFKERSRLMNQISSLNNDITRQLNDFERRRIGFWNNRRNWR